MSDNDKIVEEIKKNVETRELTLTEQKRIRSLQKRLGESSSSDTPDLLEIQDQKEGEEKPKISGIVKESLPEKEKWEENEARMYESTGCADSSNGYSLLISMANALFSKDVTLEEHVSKVNKLGRLLREFTPKDAIEGMLASQAIICNEKAMDFIRQAGFQSNREWATTHHNAASKLMARSQNALQILISYRRGGQQKMVVEHVNVAAGGQAAFGSFEAYQGAVGADKKSSRGTS